LRAPSGIENKPGKSMAVANHESGLRVAGQSPAGAIKIEGDLGRDNAAEFERLLGSLGAGRESTVVLDLHGLDIDDGAGLAAAINSLRELRARTSGVVLAGAPQMLGHNLYRLGMLGAGAIELVDMRLDEPAGF
jgi:anti-anti-sigma regulatory factor